MSHLTPDELIRWRDHGDAADRTRVLAHLADCDACRRVLSDLVRVAPSEAAPLRFDAEEFAWHGRAVRRPARVHWWRSPTVFVPVTAAVAAMLVIAVQITRGPAGDLDLDVQRGGEFRLVAPAGNISQLTGFQWVSPLIAPRYRLEVRDSTGALIASQITSTERAALDAESQARIRPGVPYRWRVVALDEAGEAIAESSDREFRISATP